MSIINITEIIRSDSDVTLPAVTGRVQRVINTNLSEAITVYLTGGGSFLLSAGQYCDCFYDEGTWFNDRDSYRAAEVTEAEDALFASQQQNLVYNHDFRYFSNRLGTISTWDNYRHPDGWVYTDNGTDGKTGYDSTLECCKIQASSDGTGARIFSQALHEFVRWGNLLKGSTVTLKAFVKGANASVKLTDGVTVQSHDLQNTGSIEEITLQIAVSTSATELTVSIESSTASNVIEVYKVYANRGIVAIETLPCIVRGVIGELKSYDATEVPPAEELMVTPEELAAGYSRLDSFINGKFGRGGNGRSKLDDAPGRFDRNWAKGSSNDPDAASRNPRGDGTTGDHVGTKQNDAIRNITGGSYGGCLNSFGTPTGALKKSYTFSAAGFDDHGSDPYSYLVFDASDVVPVGLDNRPLNRNILKTIKWC